MCWFSSPCPARRQAAPNTLICFFYSPPFIFLGALSVVAPPLPRASPRCRFSSTKRFQLALTNPRKPDHSLRSPCREGLRQDRCNEGAGETRSVATSWKRAKVNRKGRQGAPGSPLNTGLSSDLCKSLQMPSFIKSIQPHYCLPLVSLIWLLMSETTVEINLKLMFLY